MMQPPPGGYRAPADAYIQEQTDYFFAQLTKEKEEKHRDNDFTKSLDDSMVFVFFLCIFLNIITFIFRTLSIFI